MEEICHESKEMAELVPMQLKKKAGKCMVTDPDVASKTNNAVLKAVVKAHQWECQLEEQKHASVRELSTNIISPTFGDIHQRHKWQSTTSL
jgi:site-specific DNA recombinase